MIKKETIELATEIIKNGNCKGICCRPYFSDKCCPFYKCCLNCRLSYKPCDEIAREYLKTLL